MKGRGKGDETQDEKETCEEMKGSQGCSEEETDEGNDSNSDCDEEIDAVEVEAEDWIEHMKRSTAATYDQMRIAKIPCWIETHKRMKWRLAMRIAAIPAERWARKVAEWNLGLSTKYKTYRVVGRPKKDGKMKSMTYSDRKEPKKQQAMTKEMMMRGSRRRSRKVGR